MYPSTSRLTQRTPNFSVLGRNVQRALVIVDRFGELFFTPRDTGYLRQSADAHRVVSKGVFIGDEGSRGV